MRIATKVKQVVDGDTIRLDKQIAGSHIVRLLGVDAPESNFEGKAQEPHGPQAKQFLASLLPVGTTVRIETDMEVRDRYGRLLGYVYKGEQNVNMELLRQGHAVTHQIYPNLSHLEEFREAMLEALNRKRGIWDPANPLAELPFEFRDRIRNQPQDKIVGNCITRRYYEPDRYKQVAVENRVFFFDEEDAFSAGYRHRSGKPFDLRGILDAAYVNKPFSELVNAPLSAFRGVTEADAQALANALDVETIGELAKLNIVRWAQAIVRFSG
ncbi:MAG: thermonuclease family protein [Abditibacteriales bacterium]|nr:thermonuclease family protein [Abditibacteriales bacterium]MDW8364962.1 thermonuclease family protein [Abditibacteriales bacterium]